MAKVSQVGAKVEGFQPITFTVTLETEKEARALLSFLGAPMVPQLGERVPLSTVSREKLLEGFKLRSMHRFVYDIGNIIMQALEGRNW
jgi:hypothetical protein